jgi:pimeloyl-ACP methyl ester carboxylesterase
MDELLPRIEQSVLILIGSEDKLLCAGDCEKFQLLLAREQLEIIEASGHFLYLDSPEVVSRKIVTFTRGGSE